MCAFLALSEGRMICDPCKKAATTNAKVLEEVAKHGGKTPVLVSHPENCGCPCMHMRPGAWKGDKNQ